MEHLFITLLNMSLTASWIVLALVLFRMIFRRVPKWILCLMWVLVGLRLVIPGFLESPTSLIPTTEPVTVPTVSTDAVPDRHDQMTEFEYVQIPNHQPSMPVQEPAEDDAPVVPETSVKQLPAPSAYFCCSIIWIVGMAAMLFYCLFSFLRLRLQVRESMPEGKMVYICEKIATPFILGIIRPKIYLPVGLCEVDTTYVLAHEHAHLRRRDHWWKPLGFMLLTVYWFNPFMWVAYILLCRDIEGACDEKVIKEMGDEEKKPYSKALINCSAPAKWVSACPLAFGEGKLRNRIKAVLNYKKPTRWILLVCLIAGIAIAVIFLTDPLKEAEPEDLPLEEPRYAVIIEDFDKLVSYRLSENFEVSWNRGESIVCSEELGKALSADVSHRWWTMLLTMVQGLDSPTHDSFGWILYDMNKDSTPELFFVREDHSILAVFTIVNDEPMLVDAFWNRYKGVITENGELYTMSSGGADENTYEIKSLDKTGNLTDVNSFQMTHGVLINSFYDSNNEPISEEKFNMLLEEYPFELPEFWRKLDITAAKETEYSVVEQPQFDKASYEVVNNPGSSGYAWNIDYPSLYDPNVNYDILNDDIEKAVQNRLCGLFGDDPKVMTQHTKLSYTVTCATDELLSFYYEGVVTIEQTAHPVKLKLGFSFDPQTGQRLYLRNFTSVSEEFYELFLAAWFDQTDDDIANLLTDNYMYYLHHCDQLETTTSFYFEDGQLCIIYPVSFAAGGYQTIRLNSAYLQSPKKTIYYYAASGRLTETQDIYDVKVYFQEGESASSQVEVFLKAESGDQALYYELGAWDFAVLGDGCLFVEDIDGDRINEIILHLLTTLNGGTQTQIFKVKGDRITVWYHLEKNDVPIALDLLKSQNLKVDTVLVNLPDDFIERLGDSQSVEVLDFSIKDVDADDDSEIIYTKYIHWPYNYAMIAQITLDYNREINDLEVIGLDLIEVPDLSEFEIKQ